MTPSLRERLKWNAADDGRSAARLPVWAFETIAAAGTAMIATALFFNDDSTGVIAALYVSVTVAAFYFFRPSRAALQVAWIGASYGAVLAAQEPLPRAASTWAATMAVIVVVCLLTAHVSRRVDWLTARLEDASRTDALTGLLNRRAFHDVVDLELERAIRTGRPLSLLIGDLDHFKWVNDRLGHQFGDEVLKRLSVAFTKRKRRIDAAARIAGKEFALVLQETDERRAYMVAERLRSDVQHAFEEDSLDLTVSIGIASFPDHGDSPELLLQAAEEALHTAKALRRNRSVIHGPEIRGSIVDMSRPHRERGGHLATVIALAEALDVRDEGTATHSHTVARYAEATARELGLPPDRVERVRLAGVLHDVGKVGVPDAVLMKPGPLSDEEWEVMRRHPEIGARILEKSDLGDIREWVLAHQERPDGMGYPYGLSEDEIPLEARILAVADAYEAMTTDRVYRRALTPAAAQTELRECAGTQFDAEVVEVFLRRLETEEEMMAAAAAAAAASNGRAVRAR